MTKFVCRKSGRMLSPVDDEGLKALAKLPDGRDVMVEWKRSRNPRHHRLYWACVKFISEHCAGFEATPLDQIHVLLKVATGLVDTVIDPSNGVAFFTPRSIAFEALDQDEFEVFFNDATAVIATRWMPAGTTPESVRRELVLLVDGPGAVGERAEWAR